MFLKFHRFMYICVCTLNLGFYKNNRAVIQHSTWAMKSYVNFVQRRICKTRYTLNYADQEQQCIY